MLSLNHYPEDSRPLHRWNCRKARWEDYSILTDEYTANINTRWKDTNNMAKDFNAAVRKAAAETIARGERKNYRPYWIEELQRLEYEDEVHAARYKVEKEPTEDNNIELKSKTASYKRTFIQAARNNWRKKTEQLNLERGGSKLWKLACAMNNEKPTTAPIVLHTGNIPSQFG